MLGYSKFVRSVSTRVGPVLAPLLARLDPRVVFMVGFNKSGKSLLVQELAQHPGLSIYPGEGNDTLWFPGFYPRPTHTDLPPLWCDPDRFVQAATKDGAEAFRSARARLTLYRLLRSPKRPLLNDSGMLAAVLPHVMVDFPEARVVHLVRDGRVVAYKAALRTLERMEEGSHDYGSVGCPTVLEAITVSQAAYWGWTLDQVDGVAERYPGQVRCLRYEDWCADPSGTLTSITTFLGLSPDRQPPSGGAIQNTNASELRAVPPDLLVRITAILKDHLKRHRYSADDDARI